MSDPLLAARVVGGFAAVALCVAASVASAQPPPMPVQDFVMAASGADTFEIEAAYDALAQSRDARVFAFAHEMIRDHARTSQALTRAALHSGLKPPPMAISDDGAKLLTQIQSLRGVAFDRAYAKTQVLAHQQALVTQSDYARDGGDADLRQAATAAVPIIAHHLAMARHLRATLGGS